MIGQPPPTNPLAQYATSRQSIPLSAPAQGQVAASAFTKPQQQYASTIAYQPKQAVPSYYQQPQVVYQNQPQRQQQQVYQTLPPSVVYQPQQAINTRPQTTQSSYQQPTATISYHQPSGTRATGIYTDVATPGQSITASARPSSYNSQQSQTRKTTADQKSAVVINSSAIVPTHEMPHVTSGSAGSMIPAEKPYAFTTVTYAKSQPNKSAARKAQKYREYYVNSGRHADEQAGADQGSFFQTYGEGYDKAGRSNRKYKGRFVRKEKGSCGGCNEKSGSCFDTNGGCCGCLNFGCCDRGQKVPIAVDYSPEAY